MLPMSKSWTAVPVNDGEGYEPPKFYVLEGLCKKCKSGNNTLIINSFRTNPADKDQSIFKTRCLCCNAKEIYLSKDVALRLG